MKFHVNETRLTIPPSEREKLKAYLPDYEGMKQMFDKYAKVKGLTLRDCKLALGRLLERMKDDPNHELWMFDAFSYLNWATGSSYLERPIPQPDWPPELKAIAEKESQRLDDLLEHLKEQLQQVPD